MHGGHLRLSTLTSLVLSLGGCICSRNQPRPTPVPPPAPGVQLGTGTLVAERPGFFRIFKEFCSKLCTNLDLVLLGSSGR